MLSSGCDDRKCRVLLPEGGRIAWRRVSSLGNPDGVEPDGSLHLTHVDGPLCFFSYPELYPADVPPYPDISHPTPDIGWERRAFQLPRLDISGSSDSVYPESFATILYSDAVFS